jgi:hypothetical protein
VWKVLVERGIDESTSAGRVDLRLEAIDHRDVISKRT